MGKQLEERRKSQVLTVLWQKATSTSPTAKRIVVSAALATVCAAAFLVAEGPALVLAIALGIWCLLAVCVVWEPVLSRKAVLSPPASLQK